jgi:hypothetical protein
LEEAQRTEISPAEFDEVAAELGRTPDYFFKVPVRNAIGRLGRFKTMPPSSLSDQTCTDG